MTDPEHIDDIISDWPYDSGQMSVRMVEGSDGRDLIQMRLDMGLLQIETQGRPDGDRPDGHDTYYAFVQDQAMKFGDGFLLSEEQCNESDREFVQFYHRRVCWLALREYDLAVKDAEHTLAFMDFCREYSPDANWTLSHEQYRPFVLYHRAQATALSELQRNGAEEAILCVNQELDRFREFYQQHDAEEQFDQDELVERLMEFRESLRDQFEVGRTLPEQLADAVAAEKYELAAELRDELSRREVDQ